ncbi:MAG: hypothetical protein AAGF25_02135 [Pseudomonadota bacterium]
MLIPISVIVPKFFLPLPNAVLALLGTIYMVVAFNYYPFAERDGIVLLSTIIYALGMFIGLWIIYAIIDGVRGTIKWIGAKRS